MTKRPKYANDSGKQCRGRGSHADADAMATFLLAAGGGTDKPAEQIAIALGWEKRVGNARVTDMQRFHMARNHIRDGRTADGKHCTGFDLHYRTSKQGSRLMLLDPAGDPLTLVRAAAEELQGDLQQQLAMRTTNGRRVASAESMAKWCMAMSPPDTLGYQLMTTYTVEIDKFGAVTDQTIAQINAWIAGLPSAPAPSTVTP